MPTDVAINSLHSVIRSIREAIWLIDFLSEEIKTDELSPEFRERIGDILSSHLEGTIRTIEYTQDLIRSIDSTRSPELPGQSPTIAD
jgi:hypothetical protein